MCFFIDFSDFPCVFCHSFVSQRQAQGPKTARQDFEEGSIEWQILELLEDDLALKPNSFGSDLVVLVWNCWQERVKPFVQQDGGDIEFVRLMVETMLRFWWKLPCLF